jgi:biopolymer transport protein ExbD
MSGWYYVFVVLLAFFVVLGFIKLRHDMKVELKKQETRAKRDTKALKRWARKERRRRVDAEESPIEA